MAKGESLHFPALQKSVNQFIAKQKNKPTLSKTRRGFGLLSEFLKSKKENRKIEEIQPRGTQWFSEWVNSYCQKKRSWGRLWIVKPQRVYSKLQSSFEKREVFKEHRRRSRVWANKECAECSLQTPEKRMQGKQTICSRGYQRWRSVLYESKIREISSAEALINTVWLMNLIYSGLRGCDERCQMHWSDVKFWGMPTGLNI